jgi:hypothetical protein
VGGEPRVEPKDWRPEMWAQASYEVVSGCRKDHPSRIF